jgi:hypothetical protein
MKLHEDYINHSGGANGSDSLFDELGRKYGVVNHIHYWYKIRNPKSKWEHQITKEQYEEGIIHINIANKTLKRYGIEKYMYLLARSWYQVKNSDAIYAIGTFQTKTIVKGGTGYAIQMGLDDKKKIYFFDQEQVKWFYYDYDLKKFIHIQEEDKIILTKNFAGIGTRNINNHGKKAIEQVYKNTFKDEN